MKKLICTLAIIMLANHLFAPAIPQPPTIYSFKYPDTSVGPNAATVVVGSILGGFNYSLRATNNVAAPKGLWPQVAIATPSPSDLANGAMTMHYTVPAGTPLLFFTVAVY